MIRKIIKALWILLAIAVVAVVIIFVSISKGWIGYMPPVEELENPSYKFATEIFSEDEKVLGTWSYSKENRVYTAYKDLSPNITLRNTPPRRSHPFQDSHRCFSRQQTVFS